MEHFDEFRLSEEALERLKDPASLKKQIEEGKTFQEIFGFNVVSMEKFYQAACRLFEQQQYEEASDAFLFLTTLNPRVHNYWLGLGMSEQLNGEHDAALIAYNVAISTDTKDPLPHYHSAGCYDVLHDKERALSCIELALSRAGDHPEYAHIKQQAEKTHARLKKN